MTPGARSLCLLKPILARRDSNTAQRWFAVVVSAIAFFGMVKWKWGIIPVVLGAGALGLIYKLVFGL